MPSFSALSSGEIEHIVGSTFDSGSELLAPPDVYVLHKTGNSISTNEVSAIVKHPLEKNSNNELSTCDAENDSVLTESDDD